MCALLLQARGGVESWLTGVESAMRVALRGLSRNAVKEYTQVLGGGWGGGP